MRYLSLFSGVGGGDLACQWLLGWQCLGYVEWDDYCQRVLAARQADGFLDRAPIFGDIRAFNVAYAERYRGVADAVIGGPPCQPFSGARNAARVVGGESDERNMWPATFDTIGLVRPRLALLENSADITSGGYLLTILGNLWELGYDADGETLSIPDCGISEPWPERKRFWLVARKRVLWSDEYVPDPDEGTEPWCPICDQLFGECEHHGISSWEDALSEPECAGLEGHEREVMARAHEGRPDSDTARPDWGNPTPRILGATDRPAHWMDRVRATGNVQVPAVAALAWRILSERLAR